MHVLPPVVLLQPEIGGRAVDVIRGIRTNQLRTMTMSAAVHRSTRALAPSATPNERFHVMPREMPLAMVEEIIAGFGAAATRLRKAGLDGVEVLASHGYLLSQFLNPRVNRRVVDLVDPQPGERQIGRHGRLLHTKGRRSGALEGEILGHSCQGASRHPAQSV